MTEILGVAIVSVALALGACGSSDGGTCPPGETACDVADGGDSSDGASADSGPCVAVDELCDGMDNDCDLVTDEGRVCPESVVANADPFEGTLYFRAVRPSNGVVLARMWPELDESYLPVVESFARSDQFRRSNGAYVYAGSDGIIEDDLAGNLTILPSPPCDRATLFEFGFDADTLYHQCGDAIWRGDGELVVEPVERYVITLDDGRTIAQLGDSVNTQADLVAYDRDGRELSRLSPHEAFGVQLRQVIRSATTAGNKAYVLYERQVGDFFPYTYERVAFRLDENSRWQQMRWIAGMNAHLYCLILSDGTIVCREQDPEADFGVDWIIAYWPDGTSDLLWRESESADLISGGQWPIEVGPP